MPDPGSGCGQNSGPEQGRFKNIVSVALVISHRADFRFPNYSLSNKAAKKHGCYAVSSLNFCTGL